MPQLCFRQSRNWSGVSRRSRAAFASATDFGVGAGFSGSLSQVSTAYSRSQSAISLAPVIRRRFVSSFG